MTYTVDFTDDALDDLHAHRLSGDKAILRKIEQLIAELRVTPFSGTGQPEPLKYGASGRWSRRINKKHRLVYCVNENSITVLVLSAKGHYGDK